MRRLAIVLILVAAFSSALVLAWPHLSFYMLTGRLSPVDEIETLQNSIGVARWNSNGLILVDGRTLQLPGIRGLPSHSEALTQATKRGVEVDADGHVYGLTRIHHWCGNDPVREHLAKVDISDMLMFLRVGQPVSPVPEADILARDAGGTFTERGWRVGEFLQFQSWRHIKNLPQ